VGLARRFLRRALGAWGIDQDTVDTAVLCLSELVTNAVIHAPNGCVVRVLLDGRTLTVTVRDSGAVGDAAVGAPDDPFQVHGRGLQLVDALATSWGSRLDSAGTTMWFVMEL
jgi:anti-sigma regulatory factor (Ser/Thr protein kinase)